MIIGLDVGGTHADAVLLGNQGLIKEIKIPTDPSDLFYTVLSCLDTITGDIDPGRIQRIVLSTTLTTNAIAQQTLPPVGVIVAGGPGIPAEHYRTNAHYYQVAGAIDHRGREVVPIDDREVRSLGELLKKEGIDTVSVVSKFSVRNPRHEIRMAQILADLFDRVFVGHQISGHLNFARRIATSYLNAAVYPIHRKFFDAVQQSLKQKGLDVPIQVLKADGGTMSLNASMQFPGQTILSGPAASAMGSVAFAPPDAEAINLDIGGTTTDIAVIVNRVPQLHPLGIRLGGFRTLIRSLETRSIPVGGDSVVAVANGSLQIGPQRKGPAMAYGGPLPTPTDALVVSGALQDGNRDHAVRGIEMIAKQLDLDVMQAADLVCQTTCRAILDQVEALVDRVNNRPVYTIREIQSGPQLNPDRLLFMGGPAPHFAEWFKTICDHKIDLVPRWHVANAIGAALARTTCEVSLFADTQFGRMVAPEEDYEAKIDRSFTIDEALKASLALLKQKAVRMGADVEDLRTEVLEKDQFNMVRGFSTIGKNMRVKVQVKPGLIHDHEALVGKLGSRSC